VQNESNFEIVRTNMLPAHGEVSSLERRQEHRHEIRRPCFVYPCDQELAGIEAVTRDVSRRGILVQFPGGVFPEILRRVGNSARIWIDLPSNSRYSRRYLEHQARVVRVSETKRSVPLVAFEIYRVRVRSTAGQSPIEAEFPPRVTTRIQ
jgi:hypothetical protein